MKGIAQFYTYFWIIYFPTCIAYNNIGLLSSIDELMTFILIGYTFWKKSNHSTYKAPWKEYYFFLFILLFYFIYSIFFGENVFEGILLDLIQEIRPYSIIYCTCILNPQFTQKQKKMILWSMLLTLFSWIILHPTSEFEAKYGVEAEFPVLGQLAICTGMSWLIFTDDTKKNKYIAIAIVLTGMIAPKFKFLGEVVCFAYLIFFRDRRFNFKSHKTIASLALLTAVVLFVVWTRFDAYLVSGMDETSVNGRMARPESYKTAFTKIIWDYIPFGPGMGTFACNGAWKCYSPLYYKYGLNNIWGLNEGGGFICDAFYPSLAQYGLFGIFLFIIYWKRRLKTMNSINDIRFYKVAFMTFFCLLIEQTADSSWLSGKGMGYCMLLGLCLNSNLNNDEDEEDVDCEDYTEDHTKEIQRYRDDYLEYHKR